jgi:predicted nucleic acid-binding protein
MAALEDETHPFVVSPYVVAELDYFLGRRSGTTAALAALHDLAAGAYDLADFGADDLLGAAAIVERYGDLDLGVTDASLVVLAERYGTRRILTLDRRHFAALRTSRGEPFELVP